MRCAVLMFAGCFLVASAGAQSPSPAGLRFVENRGQIDDATRFSVRMGAAEVRFRPDALVVRIAPDAGPDGPRVLMAGAPARMDAARPGCELTLHLEGAAPDIQAGRARPGQHSVLLGNDPTRWRTGLQSFEDLTYVEAWPGIDLRIVERDGRLHYDVVVAPGADLAAFALRAEGGLGTRVEADGTLLVETARGPLRQIVSAAWEEDEAGGRSALAAAFEAHEGNRYGLVAPGRDPARRLVVDPGFDFGAILAAIGVVDLQLYSIAIQPGTGLQILAGYSGPDALILAYDVVTGFAPWDVIFGGTGFDQAVDVAMDAAGDLYVSGVTDSVDLPTTPGAFLPAAPGLGDAFVAHFDGAFGGLLESTYLGGTLGSEALNATLDVGDDGLVTVVGGTDSADFPIGPAGLVFDPTYNGAGDVFVTQLDPTLSFPLASTYLGGPLLDVPGLGGVDVGPGGTVSVGGWTESPVFPLLLPVDPVYGGLTDGFLTRLAPGLGGLVFSTYRGGAAFDAFNAVGVDDTGALWGAGYTESPGIPAMGPPFVLDFTYNGAGDAWLVRHAPGGGFVWGTYRGGDGTDSAMRVAVDRFARAHFSGTTNSGSPPSVIPFPITPIDGLPSTDPPVAAFDGYVALVGPAGTLQSFSGHLSLGADESLSGLALDDAGNAYASGVMTGPVIAFVAPVWRCTFPWSDTGFSTPGTTEPQLMGDGPLVGGFPLEVRLTSVVPGTPAVLVIGVVPLFAPLLGGVLVPAPTVMIPGLVVPPGGELVLPGVWPPGIPSDFPLWFQAWLPDPLGPAGYAASNGVQLLTP